MSNQEMENASSMSGVEPGGRTEADNSPGRRLAAYREERGWTIEQVASQLNLAPRQVVAIENDNYTALPGMPIVRGFIRGYAKLLRVDAAPLLAGLGSENVSAQEPLPSRNTLSTPFSEARIPSMSERNGIPFKWIVIALVLLLAAVALWAVQQGGGVSSLSQLTMSEIKQGASQISGIGGSGEASQTVDQPVSVPSVSSDEATPLPNSVGVLPDPAVSLPTVNEAPVPASTEAAAVAAPVVPVSGGDTLQLKLREDSWIEIKRASGGPAVISRVVKAGETQVFEVTEPVTLIIGNAAGVDASLRGEPLALKSAKNTNVARLTLK